MRLHIMVERTLIGILAVPGLLISGYFAAIYHNIIPDAGRYLPRFCRIDSSECASLLATSQARMFGVPNMHLGILFYFGAGVSALFADVWRQLHSFLFLGSLVAVLAGVYLTYALFFRLKIRCVLCLASHCINLLIFLILLAKL